MRQLLQRSLDEDKPPAISNNNDKDDTMNTGPATRSRTRTAPAVLIELPKQSDAEDENDEEEESKKEEEDEDSPSSASSGTKKPRKRPHYLSHEDRCQIIERIAGGEQQAALAREFGVTRAAVCHIQKHRFEILSRPVAQETGVQDTTLTTGPVGEQQLVHEVRTPAILLLITTLRDRRSDAATFRRAAGRVIMILIEDVLGQLDARTVEITTTTGYVTTGIEQRYPLCGVKLGDEGYPFSVLFHQVEVDAAEGYIHVDCIVDQRGRRQWRLDRMDLPASIASCKVLLFTATCSTGGRECKAIEALRGVGVLEKNITLVSILCASDAVVAVCSRFPQIRVVTAAIDKSIDPRTEEIIPGLGDFIARYNDEDAGT
ncbi:Uracil phosphoribosyltransferase [Phytophthora cinnamomi]|uniref:Uracil phosphoribosyltransferase n=1 Tax=Phytophthora cinnamomi TaxID=4785 RepID=UPI003559530C|nr:Uracil phosphoribosyltransferase [Phytophthora cinnamomi]